MSSAHELSDPSREVLRAAGVEPWLLEAVEGLSRRDPDSLAGVLRAFGRKVELDPGDEEVKRALGCYFDDSKPESARIEYRGACLVGFDLEDYPDLTDGESIGEQIAAKVAAWHGRIRSRVGELRLASFELEVFCMPLPSVDEFRRRLRERLGA